MKKIDLDRAITWRDYVKACKWTCIVAGLFYVALYAWIYLDRIRSCVGAAKEKIRSKFKKEED